MPTLGEKVGDDGRKTYQHRSDSLFQAVDEDGSGQIDKGEFGKLYDLIKVEVQEEHAKEKELEKQASRSKRQMKIAMCVTAVLLAVVGISVCANATLMYWVVDMMKDSSVSGGSLKVKGTNTNVQVDSALHKMSVNEFTMAKEFIDDADARSKIDQVEIHHMEGGSLHAKVKYVEVRAQNDAIPLRYAANQPVNVAMKGAAHNLKLEMALVGIHHDLYPAFFVTRITSSNTTLGSLTALGPQYDSYGAFLVNTTELVDYQDLLEDDLDELVGIPWEELVPFSSAQTSRRSRLLKAGKLMEAVQWAKNAMMGNS